MSSSPNMLQDVADFHELVLNSTPMPAPTLVSTEYCLERMRFLSEELEEFSESAMVGDIVGVADALADLIYVALGTAHHMGMPFDDIWRAVHEANMRKVRGATKRGNEVDAMKPLGWVGPERAIARALSTALSTAGS